MTRDPSAKSLPTPACDLIIQMTKAKVGVIYSQASSIHDISPEAAT